jgi:hypothetical protein
MSEITPDIHLGTALTIRSARLIELSGQIAGMKLYADKHSIDSLIRLHLINEIKAITAGLADDLATYMAASRETAGEDDERAGQSGATSHERAAGQEP